eukprot:253512_1
MQLINDIRTSIQSPPTSPVEQRKLYSRIRAYWSRCEYVLWNFVGIGLLYMFSDSLLNQYLRAHQYYKNILFHTIQSIAVIAYFFTSFKDPGYITLKDAQDAELQQLMLDLPDSDSDLPDTVLQENAPTQDLQYIEVNTTHWDPQHKEFKVVPYIPEYNRNITIDREFESTWPSNYCDQCHFIRPIRSKHCFFCGYCVSRFDHHCPLVGNCVAGGNYRYFLVFLTFESILILWSFYMSINVLFVISVDHTHSDSIEDAHDLKYRHTAMGWIFRIVFFVIMFMFLFSIIGLTGFHFYLLFTNQTTMELMRPDSIDKYLHDECKRRDKYIEKHKKHLEDDHDEEEEKQLQRNNRNEKEEYRYRFYGNITSYRTYFDEGWRKNLMLVLTGTVKPEWRTALQCRYGVSERESD